MKFAKNFDPVGFWKAVMQCRGEVRFCSMQGDILNLKSTLAQYVFSSVLGRKDLIDGGRIEFENEADRERLRPYMEE